MENYLLILVLFGALGNCVQAVSHRQTLMWTEKNMRFGDVKIVGIPGNPGDWILTGKTMSHGQSSPLDFITRITSHRIALGFQYATQSIFWSDRGFKEILSVKLEERNEDEYIYNVTVKQVFSGTSNEVNGITVDWTAGNIYWTDALYNWITVARVDKRESFKHLITTGLDKPMGITCHPMKGLLFWTDWGALPKIERSRLDGSQRMVLIDSELDHPLGMTVDYDHDLIYWVDDFRDTIEKANLDGTNRASFPASSTSSYIRGSTLFGIALFQDYIFVTDQLDSSIKIFNKSAQSLIGGIRLNAVPYDIMMYDESRQPAGHSGCDALHCEGLCLSQGYEKATCACPQGKKLKEDGLTCERDASVQKPIYIYSVGHSLCGARINIPDRTSVPPYVDVNCFLKGLRRVVGLAFLAAGNFIYYSDELDRTIFRFKLTQGEKAMPFTVQTGKVRGMVVDYLSANIYWADEFYDHIMVSRLDGRYPKILMKNIGRPRGIAVFPAERTLYWSDSYGNIWESSMDGSRKRNLLNSLRAPDGMVIDPVEKRLYYAETHGVKSMTTDGSDVKTLWFKDGDVYRDVTVFQDYYAWTDSKGQINFGSKNSGQPIRGLVHDDSLISHDVIAYGDYLQPKSQGPCDDRNGGCAQLCLPALNGNNGNYSCDCSFGYTLSSDGRSCDSFLLDGDFLMGIDPYHKTLYQLDLHTDAPFQARALHDGQFPDKFDYDPKQKMVYWVDKLAKVLKRSPLLTPGEYTVKILPTESDVDALALSVSFYQLYYSDTNANAIYRMGLDGNNHEVFAHQTYALAMAIDDEEQLVYWAQGGSNALIYSQEMNSYEKNSIWTANRNVTGLTIDHLNRQLYWCTKISIHRMDLKTGDIEMILEDQRAQFSNIAVPAGKIYVTHHDLKSIYRIFNNGGQSVNVTELVFARITDLREYERFDNTIPRVAFVKAQQAFNQLVMISVGAAVITILLIILLVGILMWRRRANKKVPDSDFKTEAHDNPVYMDVSPPPATTTTTSDQTTVTAADIHTISENEYGYIAGARTSISSRDSDLPDVVITKEGLPPELAGKLEEIGDNSVNTDTEQLVQNDEVVLVPGVDGDAGTVTFKK